MTVVAVVDTNVLVAALLTSNDASPVIQIMEGMLAARFPFVISEPLLAEYRSVLTRPRLQRKHGLDSADIDALLAKIARHAIVLKPVLADAAPDPGDQLLWELLAAHPELLLVTGDKPLLEDPGMQGRVISPREFLEIVDRR